MRRKLLAKTTLTGAKHWGWPVLPSMTGDTLLSGPDIVSLWQRFVTRPFLRHWTQKGVYFIFYQTNGGDLIPVYVGKGRVLERSTTHLGGGQYVDQVFQVYFGGTHGTPGFFGEPLAASYANLSMAWAFADLENTALTALEDRVITLLQPVTNRPYYGDNWQRGRFKLQEIVTGWLGMVRESAKWDDDAAVKALREAHEAVIGRSLDAP